MVMTKSVKPRSSVTGIALALVVACSSWIATPARSCPPKEKAVKAGVHADAKTAGAPCARCEEGEPCEKCERARALRTFEAYLADRDKQVGAAESARALGAALGYAPLLALGASTVALGDPDDDKLAEELERLGEELDRLLLEAEEMV